MDMPVPDDELTRWAELREDDAGRLARELLQYRTFRGTVITGTTTITSIVLEAERVAVLEAALRTIRSSIPGYLKGEMSEHDFALLVLENVDNAMVNKALEKGR